MSRNFKARWLFRTVPLLITNAIKAGGLGVAMHEVFGRSQPRTVEVALAAFMMAGAQISEETVLAIGERIFGGHREPHEREKR